VKFHMWKISHEVESEISYVKWIHIKLQAKFHMWFKGFHMNGKKVKFYMLKDFIWSYTSEISYVKRFLMK
jgi:hypothetical protein